MLETADIRSSIRDNAQIKSSFTLSLLLDFVLMATKTDCLPQNSSSSCVIGVHCAKCGGLKTTGLEQSEFLNELKLFRACIVHIFFFAFAFAEC